ncbi:LisH domain-containing protein armc9, partial [Borealophlyctis nickersoniae]
DLTMVDEYRKQMEETTHLRNHLRAVETSERALATKHRTLQNDYHNLITIASELVQTLAACINGEQITSAYLSSICERLASFKRNNHRQDVPAEVNTGRANTHHNTEARGATTTTHHITPQPQTRPAPNQASPHADLEKYLDYNSLRKDLSEVSSDQVVARKHALVIQALRMRLGNARSSHDRRDILGTFIANDFLRSKDGK